MKEVSDNRKDRTLQYDVILKEWWDMEYWEDFIEREGLFDDRVLHGHLWMDDKEYFKTVENRIAFCLGLWDEYKDSVIAYTLAELYDRCNVDASHAYLYKYRVRFWCKRALQLENNFHQAWALLATSYSWVAVIYNVKRSRKRIKTFIGAKFEFNNYKIGFCQTLSVEQKISIKRLERAIFCIKRAIKIYPDRQWYKNILKRYYQMRNQEYKFLGEPRII